MTQATPIKATFSDCRLVKGRKVFQLVFETPIEAADDALAALGGLPRPDIEKWFGIVALDLSKAVNDPPEKPNSAPRNFADLPAPQQAALRCNDPNFQKFLVSDGDAEKAANRVRLICHVKSRSELATNADARAKWIELDDAFYRWQRGFR